MSEKPKETVPVRKLSDQFDSPFIRDEDPRNPYGPNYEELPIETKKYYKFNKMKQFVHFEREDEEIILQQNYQYMFGFLGSAVGSIFFAYLGKEQLAKRFFSNVYASLRLYSPYYYSFFASSTLTYAYFRLYSNYIQNVCEPLLDKYTSIAVKNGFQDYKISRLRTIDIEKELASNK